MQLRHGSVAEGFCGRQLQQKSGIGALGSGPLLAKFLAREAWNAVPTAAQLPFTCREALTHAFVTCAAGAVPRYFPHGWGPCATAGGGFVLRALAVAAVWMRAPTRSSSAPAWTAAALELLTCVAKGGETELAELAAAAGHTPSELLCRVLHDATAPHASHLPTLPPKSAPRGTPASPTGKTLT